MALQESLWSDWDALTSSPEASPASQSLLRASAGPRQMTAGSGQRCVALFETRSPLGCLSRMLITSSHWYSILYRLTWRPMGTKCGRLYFQLQLSARPMSACASSLLDTAVSAWPTPLANSHTGPGAHGRDGGLKIQTAVVMSWPTPTVTGNHNRAGMSAKSGDGLSTAVKAWMTPTAADGTGGKVAPQGATNTRVSRSGKKVQYSLKQQVREQAQASAWPTPVARDYKGAGRPGQLGNIGTLNPEWEEALMAFPLGWTDIPGPPTKAKSNTRGSRRASQPRKQRVTAPSE